MKKVFFVIVGALFLGGCSQSEPVNKEPAIVSNEEEKPAVIPTKKLTMEIGGMSCEMGCGAAIRKELLATGAVERVKFDFKMGRDMNTAEISYDASKVSEKKITEIISELNDKQFNVGEISVTDYEKPKENSTSETSSNQANKLNKEASLTSIEPIHIKKQNLIDLLLSALMRK